jgi:hypothetical protein
MLASRRFRVLFFIILVVVLASASIFILIGKKSMNECPPTLTGEPSLHAGLADPNFDTDGDCIPNGEDPDANGDGIDD